MIIACTGHRTLSHPLDDVIDTFGLLLQKLKPVKVITGMAIGFDQAVALSCLKYDVPFEAAVPFEGQEKLWPEDTQVAYREILKLAQKVTIVSPGKYAAWKMHARNAYMVKNGNIIVAYCKPSTASGGTYQAVSLAKNMNKHMVNVFDLVGKHEEIERLFQATSSALDHPNKK